MFQSINPVNNQVLKSFPVCSNAELEVKLSNSNLAYRNYWKLKSIDERIEHILQVKKILQNNKSTYAELITLEMGKPITQSKAEIEKCVILCEYYAENAKAFLANKVIESSLLNSYVAYQPIGAVFGIMPWNFPFWQVFRFTIPALIAGNVVLLKHAPNVPQCALAIAELFKDVCLNEGVFQSLLIEIDQVEKVIAHKVVQGITLTGSDRAGSAVAALAGKYVKKCVLELGGTDAFIVLKDADLEKAAHTAIKSRMNNSGQTCISAKRIIVDDAVAEHFIKLLSKEIEKLNIGDPFDGMTDLSCLARPDLVHKLEQQVNSSIDEGALEIVKGGRKGTESNFYHPTILTNINSNMAVYKEEVFGPVAVVLPFENEEEAIKVANDSDYGLGASVWSKDIERAEKLGLDLEVGVIAINNMVKSDPLLPFGGVKRSGFGRELSIEGIREFVNIKSISVG